jgi:protein-S-isoprenylcysteine O-methyltransferase Ste14
MHTLDHKIPPPAVMLLFAASMWLLSASESSMALALPWRQTLAITVWCLGITISLAGLLEFWRAKTTINPLNPEAASAMVTSGIYHYSRNPMYVGLLFALVGWAVWLSHLIAFALLPLFVLYINRFQIEPEERALAAKFGEEFRQYRNSVRRWL